MEKDVETTETEDAVKQMVDRFLRWRLPENFNPDGGISFKRTHSEVGGYPSKYEPQGTNLFDATQAGEMVRYMLAGVTSVPEPAKQVYYHFVVADVDPMAAAGTAYPFHMPPGAVIKHVMPLAQITSQGRLLGPDATINQRSKLRLLVVIERPGDGKEEMLADAPAEGEA